MGRRNATTVVEAELAAAKPRLVLTCGFAGALDPALRIGDLVLAADDNFPLRERLVATGARLAQIHCAEAIAVTAVAKSLLRARTNADAVEMESGAVQEICLRAGVPCATLRVISDTADEDLPFDFNQFARDDQSLNLPKLLLALASSPSKLGALLRLQRHCRLAADRLAAALITVLSPG
jgi:nucleoside phosphorylase